MCTHRRSRSSLDRQRDLHEFRSLLASWNERSTNYEYAYNYEVQRNNQITQAYRLLSDQHERALKELAVEASKYRSLQKELEIMQTESLAQDAVLDNYARRVAAQLVCHRGSEKINESLVRRISEIETQLVGMKDALISAGEELGSSSPSLYREWQTEPSRI